MGSRLSWKFDIWLIGCKWCEKFAGTARNVMRVFITKQESIPMHTACSTIEDVTEADVLSSKY